MFGRLPVRPVAVSTVVNLTTYVGPYVEWLGKREKLRNMNINAQLGEINIIEDDYK
mgnify:CR=1 FL=1